MNSWCLSSEKNCDRLHLPRTPPWNHPLERLHVQDWARGQQKVYGPCHQFRIMRTFRNFHTWFFKSSVGSKLVPMDLDDSDHVFRTWKWLHTASKDRVINHSPLALSMQVTGSRKAHVSGPCTWENSTWWHPCSYPTQKKQWRLQEEKKNCGARWVFFLWRLALQPKSMDRRPGRRR